MSEHDQNQASGQTGRVLRHDEWESLLADALDGTLSVADATAFKRHQSECAPCEQMFQETQRGMAWMGYLATEPEPPADLLGKILARTSGQLPAANPGVTAPPLVLPGRPAWRRVLLPAARQAIEPRLLMTAAMAFFSIALTLNLAGVKLTQLRASDLQPSRLRANLTRQYYATNEQVTKYYENLRVVYEMESRVRELKRSTEAEPTPQPAPRQPARDGSGSPSSTAPQGENPPSPADRYTHFVIPAAVVPARFDCGRKRGEFERGVSRALQVTTEGQAQRSLV
jgi:hypothetical protein